MYPGHSRQFSGADQYANPYAYTAASQRGYYNTGGVIPGTIQRGPVDGPIVGPLGTPGYLARTALGNQEISPNAPGYHNEYPVKTIEHEPVTRIETVPVTK